MVRQSELDDLEKKWAAENERIMREHPPVREYDSLPPPEVEAKPAEPAAPKTEAQP
jgi:sec-independent protein translocase protein TatB